MNTNPNDALRWISWPDRDGLTAGTVITRARSGRPAREALGTNLLMLSPSCYGPGPVGRFRTLPAAKLIATLLEELTAPDYAWLFACV